MSRSRPRVVVSSPLWGGICLAGLLGFLLGSLGARPAVAQIPRNGPLAVHILYDNSGSMYPGYRPGSGVTKSSLGVRFIHEYPWFRGWLNDFAARQEILGGTTLEMSAFTSANRFRPSDVLQIHPRVPLAQFDADTALDRVEDWGQQTFLVESLEQLTERFEGLVWLITDNIVETGRGQPDEGVRRFFQHLNDNPRYRSVHLFKLPFVDEERNQRSDLAIYGILVSQSPLPEDLGSRFDRKFRDQLRTAQRGSGQPLFPGSEHLKLKDLAIAPFDLRFEPNLTVEIVHSKKNLFREFQTVILKLKGVIQSNLTQHSVTDGRYRLRTSSFEPDAGSRSGLRIQTIPGDTFPERNGMLAERIPPGGSLPVDVDLESSEPITLRSEGFGAWLKSAFVGARAEYTGKVHMSFDGIRVRFEPDRMAGIFGIEQSSDVFDFTTERSIQAAPANATISFVLHGSSRRGLVAFPLLLLVLGLLGLLLWFFLQQERYRVTVGDAQSIVALRRFGSYPVRHQQHWLGRLRRGIGGYFFRPARGEEGVEIESSGSGNSFRARIRDIGVLGILIEPLQRKARARRSGRPGGGPRSGGRGASRTGGMAIRRPGSMVTATPRQRPPESASPSSAGSGRPSPRRGDETSASGASSSGRKGPRPSLRRPK